MYAFQCMLHIYVGSNHYITCDERFSALTVIMVHITA